MRKNQNFFPVATIANSPLATLKELRELYDFVLSKVDSLKKSSEKVKSDTTEFFGNRYHFHRDNNYMMFMKIHDILIDDIPVTISFHVNLNSNDSKHILYVDPLCSDNVVAREIIKNNFKQVPSGFVGTQYEMTLNPQTISKKILVKSTIGGTEREIKDHYMPGAANHALSSDISKGDIRLIKNALMKLDTDFEPSIPHFKAGKFAKVKIKEIVS